jgi:Ca2+/Na+ antiporter
MEPWLKGLIIALGLAISGFAFSPVTVTGWKVAGVIIVICLIIWVISAIIGAIVYYSETTKQTWDVSLFSVIVTMVIIAFSMQCKEKNWWAFTVYIALLLVFIVFVVISLFPAAHEADQPNKVGLRKIWNPDKGLGGGGFGDFANSVGILAGVGAYQLQGADPGWFWLGQFGAALAMLIGLSLCLRWIRKAKLDKKNPMTDDKWFSALMPYLAGVFTFLAIILSTDSLENLVGEHAGWLSGLQTAFLGLMIILGAFMIYKFYESSRNFVWLLVGIVASNLICIIFLITFFMLQNDIPGWMGPAFGILATLFGVTLEAVSLWQVENSFITGKAFQREESFLRFETLYYLKNWKDPLRVMRGLDIVLGNLALFALVFWVCSSPPDPTSTDMQTYNPVQWFIFCGGIVLMVQASLGGIIMSANDVANDHAQTAPLPVIR